MSSNDKVEYVYNEKKDLPLQEDRLFSEPYYKDSSDSNDGDPPPNTNLSDNENSKRSKPKRQKSRYDEDNYALPDPEPEGEVKLRKVDDQFGKLEEKLRAQGRQIGTLRVVSISLFIILSVIVAANLYMNIKTGDITGKTINT